MTGFAVNHSNYFRACTLDLHFIRSGADGEASNGKISEYCKEEGTHTEMLNFLPICISLTSLPSPAFRHNPRTDHIS